MSTEYTKEDVYKFASNGNFDELEIALNPDTPSGFTPEQTEQIVASQFPDYVPIREKVLGPIL